jgi:acetyl esterase/lipase
MNRRLLAFAIFVQLTSMVWAEAPDLDKVRVLVDIPYKSGEAFSEYENERCKLDIFLPPHSAAFSTLVWFHGGGLKNGDKDGRKVESDSVKTYAIAKSLASSGIAVVSVNYRLSPKATFPAYIQDAAAAVAWTRQHIAEHNGDPTKIFIGGHSAGGYLTLMLGMDEHYLADAGMKVSEIAGFIPISGQTMTHYTVREERGIDKNTITADEAAPVHFIRKTTPPFLVLYADRDMAARAEENAYFVASMRGVGNERATGIMIEDRTHGSIASKIVNKDDPARTAILEFMKVHSSTK